MSRLSSRLLGLLHALAWALAVAIAWTERRDPARPQPVAPPDNPAPNEPASAPPAPAPEPPPASPPVAGRRASSIPVRRDESAEAVGLAGSTAPSPPTPPPTSTAGGGSSPPPSPPPSAPDAPPPTAAAPIAAEPVPGRPIDGTGAPIVDGGGGARPIPTGAVAGDGTATCPPDHPIKGNASSMIYHQPGQPSYERTVAELCFVSKQAAEAAGYRAPRR